MIHCQSVTSKIKTTIIKSSTSIHTSYGRLQRTKCPSKTHHYRTSLKPSKCSWKKKQRLKSLKSLKINTIIFLNAKQAAIDNTGPSKYCIKSKYYIIIRIFMVMHACMYIRSSTTGYTHYPVICRRKCYYGLHQSCCEHYAHVTDTKVPSLRAP